MDTGIHKPKYYCAYISWIIMIKVKVESIATVYNMVAYKLKVMNVEDDILKFSPITKNKKF